MIKYAVIADDLTGGNAAGILMKKEGLNTITMMNNDVSGIDVDAVVFSTNSRGLDKTDAYNRVFELANKLKKQGVCHFSKRIDSTMRGNIGTEIDGILDALGDNYYVICTPAYPDSGRTVKDGKLLVNGIPLAYSEVAKDPKSMITTSSVKDIVCKQSKYMVAKFTETDMQNPMIACEKLNELFLKGNRIIVCDAEENEQIERIAKTIAKCEHNIIIADAGVLTAAVVKEIFRPHLALSDKKVVAIVGSVNIMARFQLEQLWDGGIGAGKVIVDTAKLLKANKRAAEISRVIQLAMTEREKSNVVTIVSDGIYPENRIAITEELSEEINQSFAEIAEKLLKEKGRFQGLYTSGGDITVAVYERLQAQGIEILNEVLPLAVYGKLIGGFCHGMSVLTKGGSQGDNRAIETCVRYLFDRIQNQEDL